MTSTIPVSREIRDRISFLNFLGYLWKLLDWSTIWYFRGRLSKTGKERLLFNEIIGQIMWIRLLMKKGNMQVSSFIESDRRGYRNPR